MHNPEPSFTLTEVRDYWNKISEKYDKFNLKIKGVHFQRFKEALRYIKLKPGMRILNIFSRTAEAIEFIETICKEVILINAELSEGMLHQAKEKYPENNFIHLSPYGLPFHGDSFDLVLSLETLEHIPEPFVFLEEIRRVLRTQGRLVMTLPPARVEYLDIICSLFHLHHGEGPHRFLSSQEVKRLLKSTGFRLIEHRGTVLIPLGYAWLRSLSEKIENKIQNTFLREFCIRQVYVCDKSF